MLDLEMGNTGCRSCVFNPLGSHGVAASRLDVSRNPIGSVGKPSWAAKTRQTECLHGRLRSHAFCKWAKAESRRHKAPRTWVVACLCSPL